MKLRWFKNFLFLLNIIMYLVVIGLWIILSEYMLFCISLTIANVALTCLLIIWDRERFKFLYQSEQFRKFSIHFVNTCLVFFILGLLNYVSFKHPLQWDLTGHKSNTLTEQTQQVLRSVDQDIKFTVFSHKNNFGSFRQLLELFRFVKSNVTIEYVDIELSPLIVQKYNITNPNSILVEIGEKNFVVTEVDELHLVNAILRLGKRVDPLIGVVTGHNEGSWDDDSKEGLSFLKKLLVNNNYLVRSMPLKNLPSIPKEMDALVLWGPKDGFFEHEIKIIKDYLNSGGKVLVALDPQINGDKITNVRNLFKDFGVLFHNDLVIDRLKNISGSNGTVPIVEKFNADHPITKGLSGVFFPLSSSVGFVDPDAEKSEILAESMPFPASWADNDPAELLKGQITFNEKNDRKGPVGLMAAKEDLNNKNRIVAFGTSNFVVNAYNRFSKNYNLFLNSLAWLVGSDELISLNLPSLHSEPVFISGVLVNTIFYFSILFAPMVLFILAAYFYRRRSKL